MRLECNPSNFYFEKHNGFQNWTIKETAKHHAFIICKEFGYKKFQNFSIIIKHNKKEYCFNFKVTSEPIDNLSHEIQIISRGR